MPYKDEAKRAEQRKRWTANNPEKAKASTKRWNQANPENVRANCRRWAHNNPEKILAIGRNAKIAAINAYGGRCVCCGEADLPFLTIGHGRNDGAAHRRAIGGRRTGVRFYQWLKKFGFPSDLGLVVECWNCNSSKPLNGGSCPHRTTADSYDGIL